MIDVSRVTEIVINGKIVATIEYNNIVIYANKN